MLTPDQIKFLVNGTNTIAVEVHQNSAGSSDIYWDMDLYTSSGAPALSGVILDSANGTQLTTDLTDPENRLKLNVKGKVSGATNDLSGASIVYKTDREDLLTISDGGVVSLTGHSTSDTSANVWAEVTYGGETMISSRLLVSIRDITPPVTVIKVEGQTGEENFNNKTVTVSVYAEDGNGYGVERTDYRINQADWIAVTDSFTVQDEGINNVEYRSVDKAGNVEEAKKVTIGIDKMGPVINPPGISMVFHTDTLNLPVEVMDTLSGVKDVSITLDGNKVGQPIVKDPISLSLGEHSLVIQAVDHAGNNAIILVDDISYIEAHLGR